MKPDRRYIWRFTKLQWFVVDTSTSETIVVLDGDEAKRVVAERNASHRLKRLCEEIADMHVMLDIQPPGTGPFTRENKALEQFRAAILALGEDNEHS